MFLKNKKVIFEIRRSKVTDYAALIIIAVVKTGVSFLIFDTRGLILTSLDHRIKSLEETEKKNNQTK